MEPMHRIKVKIGAAEFDAEGSPDLVKEQYEAFLRIVSQQPQPVLKAETIADPEKPEPQVVHGKIPQPVIDRVFKQGNLLTLMDTPKTDNAEADALLVLVYGHTELAGMQDVTAATLVKSADKTGLNIDRVSRTIEARKDLIRSSGVKKGTRYSLNNRGIAEAERLIRAMVE